MSNITKYGDWGADDAEKSREESEAAGQGNYYKFKVGRNTLRILPPKIGRKDPFRVVYKHFIELPGVEKMAFTCPRHEKKQFCPACAKVDELRATGIQADYDLAGDILAQRNVYCNVIDRDNPEKGVQIARIGKQLHEALLALRTDETNGGNFVHPVDGFDIVVTRVGTGKKDTKYTMVPARDNSPIADDVVMMEEILESMPDLEQQARMPTEEDLAKLAPRRSAAQAAPPRGRAASGAGQTRGRGNANAVDHAMDTEGKPA